MHALLAHLTEMMALMALHQVLLFAHPCRASAGMSLPIAVAATAVAEVTAVEVAATAANDGNDDGNDDGDFGHASLWHWGAPWGACACGGFTHDGGRAEGWQITLEGSDWRRRGSCAW